MAARKATLQRSGATTANCSASTWKRRRRAIIDQAPGTVPAIRHRAVDERRSRKTRSCLQRTADQVQERPPGATGEPPELRDVHDRRAISHRGAHPRIRRLGRLVVQDRLGRQRRRAPRACRSIPASAPARSRLPRARTARFAVAFTRGDREQDLSGLTVTTPPGLLGRVAGVEQCAEAQRTPVRAVRGA